MTHETHRAKGPFANLRAALMPNCREMSRYASRSLDSPLPFAHRLGFGLHLLLCRFCRRYRRQLLWLRRMAPKPLDADPKAPALSAEARLRLKQSLRDVKPEPGPRTDQGRSSRSTPRDDHGDRV